MQALKEENKLLLCLTNLRLKYETNKKDGMMINPQKLLIQMEYTWSTLSVRVEFEVLLLLYTISFLFLAHFNFLI